MRRAVAFFSAVGLAAIGVGGVLYFTAGSTGTSTRLVPAPTIGGATLTLAKTF